MICTGDSEQKIAALNVILQPAPQSKSIPLTEWLADFETPPVWIPLVRRKGVTKAMAVLSQPAAYPALMQAIFQQISYNTAIQWQGRFYNIAGVEVNPHELHILEIPIFPSEPLPPTLGRAIHALCFEWLGNADPALAERLHAQDNFPITLVMKRGENPTEMILRIGLLQRELLAPLLWGMSKDIGGDITLTGKPCRLSQWLEVRQSVSYETLLQVSPQNPLELEFLSPTSFKQNQTIQPFPLPELVFSSLLRRWNTFAPENLRLPAIEWQGLTAAFELRTLALKMKGGAEIGTRGWVRYEFPDGEQARIATILAHFAGFSGVGRKTAMGMGQARVITRSMIAS